ncbi:hypothetical protein [Spiroplasma endosymbiont of Eupeodes luniger]|uniref:hypothetical protein n=1 Tax=Spiroplasma endosymbiont of Eupeodes luniger TaxID=3066300 RepID=UPI0030D30F04
MINAKLPTSIDKSQVDIKIDQDNKATIKPIKNSTKYKGEVIVTYNLDTKQTLETTLPQVQRNLGTIETNGQQLTGDMINAKLPTSIDKSQVDIKIDQDNKATIKPIKNSTKYKGEVIVTYNLDTKQTLETKEVK